MGVFVVGVAIFLFAVWSLIDVKSRELGWLNVGGILATWGGWFAYETFLIDCPLARCNIRPDLVLVMPLVLLNTVLCLVAAVRHFSEDEATDNGSGPSESEGAEAASAPIRTIRRSNRFE